jgi:Domain of unknown function (DUF4129)
MANFRFLDRKSRQLSTRRVEDSPLLRLLVQMMVCVSILTVGIVTGSDKGILLMVLLATASGYWSWCMRHHRDYWVVRLITLSYLIAAPVMFLKLGQSDFDPARFLSVAIMLLLALTPACWTTRQNLSFALLLSWVVTGVMITINVNPLTVTLMFLLSLVALPAMWLGYRSQINLPPLTGDWRVAQLPNLPWQNLGRVAGITLGFGLLLSLLLFLLPKPNIGQLSTDVDRAWLEPLAKLNKPATEKSEQVTSAGEFNQMAKRYAQLSPDLQTKLQVKTQEIVQYQRRTAGKIDPGSTADQVQDLAAFLETHTQLGATNPQLLDSLWNSCPQPQSCQMQGSRAELAEAYELMARSIDITQHRSPTLTPDHQKSPVPKDQVNWAGAMMLLVIGGLAIACCTLWVLYDRKLRNYRRRFAKLPPLEQIYRQLLKQLKNQGLPAKQSPQSPLEYAALVGDCLPPPSAQIVDRISVAYVAWRYGHKSANVDLMQRLLQELITIQAQESA